MPDESDFESFKTASDHYHHYKEDIAYYGEMGFQIYRFTMAWSRIFPNGDETEPNDAGVEFYSNMLAELENIISNQLLLYMLMICRYNCLKNIMVG